MKKNIHQHPGDKEAPYVYAHMARRLKQQKKEQRKYRQRAIRKNFSRQAQSPQHPGCSPNERRGARPLKKSVSFKEDREAEQEIMNTNDSRDDAPEDRRCDATDDNREDFFSELPNIRELSPALEYYVYEALKAVNLIADESDGENDSDADEENSCYTHIDGDASSCYYSEQDSADDEEDAVFSQDTTLPASNRSIQPIGSSPGISAAAKKIIIPPGKMGVAIVDSKRGPLVTAVSKSCPVNLMVGDVITSVDGRNTSTLSAGQVLQILLARSDQHRFLVILRIEGD